MNQTLKNSLFIGAYLTTGISTVSSLIGFSLLDIFPFSSMPFGKATFCRLLIIVFAYLILSFVVWIFLYCYWYRKNIEVTIGKNSITIKRGDIFKENGLRVIPVDTHFGTNVDDVVISKKSLHGQLVLNHGKAEYIKMVVKEEARRRRLSKGENKDNYLFELGTAIPYQGNDGEYLMIALTQLNENYEAHTNTQLFEQTLFKIWHEINRTYAGKDIVLPVLGSGITRFDDTFYSSEQLITFMIHMLKRSKKPFDSKITILLHAPDEVKTLRSLHEHKQIFELMR